MGRSFPPHTEGGGFVDAMVADARSILRAVGYGTAKAPRLEVGIGLDVGPAHVGIVGEARSATSPRSATSWTRPAASRARRLAARS